MGDLIQRILVAIDLSEYSGSITARAAELARALQAEVIAVHVYDPDVLMQTLAESGMALDQYVDSLQHSLTRLFSGEEIGSVRVHAQVVEGSAVGRAILDAAQRAGADLIVMGTHGRTGVWRTILGSVAEDVLRHARLPVLVVPMRAAVSVGPAHARGMTAAAAS